MFFYLSSNSGNGSHEVLVSGRRHQEVQPIQVDWKSNQILLIPIEYRSINGNRRMEEVSSINTRECVFNFFFGDNGFKALLGKFLDIFCRLNARKGTKL